MIVRDISPAQIQFHNRLLDAVDHKTLNEFTLATKKEMREFARQGNIDFIGPAFPGIKTLPDFCDEIDLLFNEAYKPLENAITHSITTIRGDIFDAQFEPPQDGKRDVIFLSTIVSLNHKKWPLYYRHMRHWLENGVTVVYTLLIASFTDDLLRELTESFDDIANRTYFKPESTRGLIHIKLEPKNRK